MDLLAGLCLASASGCGASQAYVCDAGGFATAGVTRAGSDAFGAAWPEGSAHRGLRVNFTGYGSVGPVASEPHVLRIAPAVSTTPGETHATLVTSTACFGDVDVTYRLRTIAHLRVGEPNPWEVGWTLWHYQSDHEFYYFVLKPNGWELGKADPAYPGAQRFLATGSAVYDPFVWHDIHVVQRGASMSIYVDGQHIVDFTDTERPYTGGAVGFYSEDAEVDIGELRASAPR